MIATDGGYLPQPVALNELRLSPGERAEVLIDFGNGRSDAMLSLADMNSGMGGMMGRFQRFGNYLAGITTGTINKDFSLVGHVSGLLGCCSNMEPTLVCGAA